MCFVYYDIIIVKVFGCSVAPSEPPSRVVTPLQSATAAVTSQNVDMSYYNKLLSHVPEDHTTIELILHCMVEQVCLPIRLCLYLVVNKVILVYIRRYIDTKCSKFILFIVIG